MNIPVFPKFLPKTVKKISSPINDEISVIEQFGRRKIVVGGLTQSGPMAEKVWEPGIKYVSKKAPQVNNVLILGLGGGSLVKLLNNYFPKAKIVGIEIDPIMINLGKEYLELRNAKNLKIIIDDASNYLLYAISQKLLFDLIFVDSYIGEKIPNKLQTEIFLKNQKKILNAKGIIVFNCLYYKNHISEAKIFLDKLYKIFNDVDCRKVFTNLFIFCR